MGGWGRVLAARDRFAAAARVTGPEAPTLCDGWTVRHLVGHLLTLRSDPLSWPGIALPRFAALTQRRMAAATASGFDAAVERLATRSPFMPPVFETPRSSWTHHLGEYVVHTEDIVRANDLPPTVLDAATTDALWARVLVAARQLYPGDPAPGLLLARTDTAASARVLEGSPTLTVRGAPLELLVWAHRGCAMADVGTRIS